MAQAGYKYTYVSGHGGSSAYMGRCRALWDITDRFDAGVHAGIVRHEETNTQTLCYTGLRSERG
jgi:hypothetical protein